MSEQNRKRLRSQCEPQTEVTNIVRCTRRLPPKTRRHAYESRLHLGLRGGRLS